ncbi:nucleotide disphospho-sugar-binding domain-containing protein [Actinokineospora enzanensis]|uniref:nucleotide disphospho-sugar-binding domain-containing protein n=1 Tax=Actinokineospora enzanensis TaxID=155975 RepID=UPI000366DA78|nr:nucleotide disphospho-sugar-binding domain-containing protein [Actinokineospora enzanensis]
MRVLFTSWSGATHYFPQVPLGWALQAAGHEVRVASQPALAPVITGSGLTAVSVGPDVDYPGLVKEKVGELPIVRAAPDWRERHRGKTARAHEVFGAMADVMVDDLLEFARWWRPDLVVFDPTSYAGPLVAALVGVPAVRNLWGPDLMYRFDEFAGEALRPLCERLGLAGVRTLGAMTVDPCPPRLQIATDYRRQGMRYVPYNGPGVLPRWLLDEPPTRPRVCVSWGTVLGGFGQDVFLAPRVARAIADLDVEVVLAIAPAHRELIGDLPPGVRVVESLPFHMLLPTCDLMISQGGGGTILTALLNGVPMLVVPQLPDHAFHARCLVNSGAGASVLEEDATEERIREQVLAMLGDSPFRAAAGELRADILAQPSPIEVVDVLADLAGSPALTG